MVLFPIIKKETEKELIKIIKKYNIKSILEIGTANSYSSHIFARYGAKVLSLEKKKNGLTGTTDFEQFSKFFMFEKLL